MVIHKHSENFELRPEAVKVPDMCPQLSLSLSLSLQATWAWSFAISKLHAHGPAV